MTARRSPAAASVKSAGRPDPKLVAELVAANRVLAREGVLDGWGHVSVRHNLDPNRYLLSRSRAPELVSAGDILEFLIGDLKPKATELTGQIIEFSQKEFSRKPEAISMADTGYVYVPKACAEGRPCKLHVAIHGCKQNAASIGMAYVTDTGYLPWADSNNIVLLFPQTTARNEYTLRGVVNPKACWNWWGYGGDDNYHTRVGYQIAAIRSMVDRLAGGR